MFSEGGGGLKKHGFIPNVFIENPPLCFVLIVGGKIYEKFIGWVRGVVGS